LQIPTAFDQAQGFGFNPFSNWANED
jgi:hypothetical protein